MRRLYQRPSPRQERAERWLLAAVPGGLVAFPLLLSLLTPPLGGIWSTLVAIVLVATPVTALYRAAVTTQRLWRNIADGVACGVTAAVVYAIVFTAPWIPSPGY